MENREILLKTGKATIYCISLMLKEAGIKKGELREANTSVASPPSSTSIRREKPAAIKVQPALQHPTLHVGRLTLLILQHGWVGEKKRSLPVYSQSSFPHRTPLWRTSTRRRLSRCNDLRGSAESQQGKWNHTTKEGNRRCVRMWSQAAASPLPSCALLLADLSSRAQDHAAGLPRSFCSRKDVPGGLHNGERRNRWPRTHPAPPHHSYKLHSVPCSSLCCCAELVAWFFELKSIKFRIDLNSEAYLSWFRGGYLNCFNKLIKQNRDSRGLHGFFFFFIY